MMGILLGAVREKDFIKWYESDFLNPALLTLYRVIF